MNRKRVATLFEAPAEGPLLIPQRRLRTVSSRGVHRASIAQPAASVVVDRPPDDQACSVQAAGGNKMCRSRIVTG